MSGGRKVSKIILATNWYYKGVKYPTLNFVVSNRTGWEEYKGEDVDALTDVTRLHTHTQIN